MDFDHLFSAHDIEEMDFGVSDCLAGGIDFHTHSGPSFSPRHCDDLDLAYRAKSHNMAGVVLKAHEGDTSARAALVAKASGINVYGGVVLNEYVGGLNPKAVEASLKLGGKIVWMPTVSADYNKYFLAAEKGQCLCREYVPGMAGGLTILDHDGCLLPEVIEILEMIASQQAVLATGHLSPGEAMILVDHAFAYGVTKVVVNHPDLKLTPIPLEDQVKLARKGAFLEKCLISLTPSWKSLSPEDMAASIKMAGADKCIVATDFGQNHHPSPPKGMEIFIKLLLDAGLDWQDIRRMVVQNPGKLLGIN